MWVLGSLIDIGYGRLISCWL